ncbi:hypothetical protein GHT06_022637 [Daphnia sinensis]|uniref:Uncharacterized protein n=1 Tax=Daphnia sinensis TaxID=1820382 RepID=A0AAD5KZ07_9CRUS|nr:hypothetical protein GHT06_022637 [Daphnia sinensis]
MLTCVQLDRIIHGRQQENKSQKGKHNKARKTTYKKHGKKKKKNRIMEKHATNLYIIIDLHHRICFGPLVTRTRTLHAELVSLFFRHFLSFLKFPGL